MSLFKKFRFLYLSFRQKLKPLKQNIIIFYLLASVGISPTICRCIYFCKDSLQAKTTTEIFLKFLLDYRIKQPKRIFLYSIKF